MKIINEGEKAVNKKILKAFEGEEASPSSDIKNQNGPVARIARKYSSELNAEEGMISDRLLGFVLKLSYDGVTIVTCDPWKRSCGGVPRNSFVFLRLSEAQVSETEKIYCNRIVMVRITDSVPTPVDGDISQTIFQIHKAQANIDPLTNKELQWSALKGSVVGTFYDRPNDGEGLEIAFGPDIDTFFSPHAYEVFVPSSEHLEELINFFSEHPDPIHIGDLRYTETPSIANDGKKVAVRVDPTDFTGKSYGHRTALFGKTRFGKSNTMKVVIETCLSLNEPVGQIIFDPSGEYTYWNAQDNGCIYLRHKEKCVRYSLSPQEIEKEKELNIPMPEDLKINFFEQPDVGHGLISELWASVHQSRPDYIDPTLNWEAPSLEEAPEMFEDKSAYNHFWRSMGLWYAILVDAGFSTDKDAVVPVDFIADVKKALLADESLADVLAKKPKTKKNGDPELDEDGNAILTLNSKQKRGALPAIFKAIYRLHKDHKNDNKWFGMGTDGSPYFNPAEISMLKILGGEVGSGSSKFNRFIKYHSASGSDIFSKIVEHSMNGKTVLLDLAMGDEGVRRSVSKYVCRKLMDHMMRLFAQNGLGKKFVVLYFEEAHNLFPKDDKGLGEDIYNKIAKEGAKFHISMVYATQSISTLSPDLLKNTENFIVAHLDDDREVKELKHKRAFRDVADDVERIVSKGYVRMNTLSLPFALPVQIRKFSGALD